MNTSKTLPGGGTFLELIAKAEAQCSTESFAELPQLGLSAPACYESLGDVLSLLYAEASCFHECKGDHHFWQRITARIVSHALAAIRLAALGYYDESLALTRNIGEVANLLFLFAAKSDLIESWRMADDRERIKRFGPASVRRTLEELGLRPPVDRSRYSLLSEVGVHLVPSVAPQMFNEHGRSTLGSRFQYEGLIATLNELGIAVAECAGGLSVLLPHLGERRRFLQLRAEVLLNMVGQLDLKASRQDASD